MAKNNKNKEQDISKITGISIIRNEGRLIYSPVFSNKGYILTSQNGRHYKNYVTGYVTAMIVFLVAYIISNKLLVALLISGLVLATNIALFYKNFISKASTVEFKSEGKKKKEPFVISQARQLSYPRIKELIICCILLVIIFIFLYFWQKPEGAYLVVTISSLIASIVYLIANIQVWFYKKKHFDNN